MVKHFREHFAKFTEMIRNDEHFGFARYSDGELYILQNKELVLDNGLIQIGDKKLSVVINIKYFIITQQFVDNNQEYHIN